MTSDPAGYYEAMTGQTDGSDNRISDEQRVAARRVICANATDGPEADVFLRMCGIHPLQCEDEVDYRVGPARPMNEGQASAPAFTFS
jgi:hypothetical protein